jgi:hypothetical protein
LGWRSLAGVLALLGFVGDAGADLNLQFGIENFRWREYDGSGRLLEESGPRFRLGVDWQRPFVQDENLWLQLSGALYVGKVDYDGRACTLSGACTPFVSDTNYSGASAEALLVHQPSPGWEAISGVGLDTWVRRIRGHLGVQGTSEEWITFYALLGGGAYWRDASIRYHARVGLKYPFYTLEYPDAYNVTLQPQGRGSFFARLSADFITGGRPQWGVGLYYDSYRFDISDRERDGSVFVWQPESHQDVVGLYATVYLY